MTVFQITAIILTFSALGGYLNRRFIKLPATIGQMVFALVLSLAAVAAGELGEFDLDAVRSLLAKIDFSQVLLHGMLSFLLFAGALHIRIDDLKNVRVAVGALATFGVVIATLVTGALTWLAAHLIGIPLNFIYALVFGALISPTDPIAVMAMLKQAGVPKDLATKIGGESLLNDGVGIVVFQVVLGLAVEGGQGLRLGPAGFAFFHEALGGIGLGLMLGWGVYRLLRTIDDYKVEVLMTLALVSGGYALAEYVGVSAPLCMVAAGLVIGNWARYGAMSEHTATHLDMFWELIDEILNAVLFLLIGLEILMVPLSWPTIALGGLVVIAVLIGRFVSVGVPIGAIRLRWPVGRGTIRLLTWGGLRGGLSIAMALSLPDVTEKPVLLALTYIVVMFSILIQGLTFPKAIRMTLG